MAKKQFKAESKRLLDMMINSIYTHREIFLRELISNASDAIDKLYFKSLTDDKVGLNKSDFAIDVSIDKDARVLKITDNGIGMTKDELENNLGTIAKSGSFAFKNENEKMDDVSIIGQFGVGFYSAFMVAKTVVVTSKAYGEETAFKWESNGADGYTISECEKESAGTEITLIIKDNTEDDNYDEFLEQYRIQGIIKKYSDYIRFPIKMDMEHSRKKEGAEGSSETEWETYTETVTINSMTPIWKKSKSDLTDEEYNKFYQEKYFDYTAPISHMHVKTEGTATYTSLMYIPSKAPYDYYTKEYEKGLQLYSNGVMIMEKCGDLLPDYFSFVKGLVDSEDLSLNISRELLQHDRQLKLIAKSLEKTIRNELTKLQKNEREKYEEFWKAFGMQIKFGVYNGYGANKDTLQDLMLFTSSNENKLTTLDEYVTRMKEDQKHIYYATGESVVRIENLPQVELVREKGYEILYFTENVDEFAIKMMMNYKDKEFKSVSAKDLDLETPEEREEIKAKAEEAKAALECMKEALSDVKEVRVSQRLKSHPVCLTSDGELSIEMEKTLNEMPSDQKVKAEKVLEINPSHPIYNTLLSLYETDKEKLKNYAKILYSQALLIEGLSVENPSELTDLICDIMANK